MGTIADKLQKLLSTKEAIKQAIIQKGVSVDDSDTFFSYADRISEIQGGGGGTEEFYITDAAYLFYGGARIAEFDKYFERIKDCTSYKYTFGNFSRVSEFDVKSLLAKCSKNGCDCSNMFDSSSYTAGRTLKNVNEADYSRVTYMNDMFRYCQNNSLAIDIVLKNLEKVEEMDSVFESTKITSIDLSQANNSICNTLDSAFYSTKIVKLTFGGLTYKGIYAGAIAQNATTLTEIIWNNFCPSSLSNAFSGCTALKKVDFADLDSSKLTNVYYTFNRCTALEEVLNADLGRVTTTSYTNMFGTTNLPNLKRLTFKKNTTFGQNSAAAEIILNLTKLTGFDAAGYTEMVNSLLQIEYVSSAYIVNEFIDANGDGFDDIYGLTEEEFTNRWVYGVRTIKLNTTLYNSLTDEQKALATNKGYNLSHGTS